MRAGVPGDADGILRLIEAHLESGHLLPRSREDIARRAGRFAVLEHAGAIVGCAELAPLSVAVAEVRSLVVDRTWRGRRLGPRLIEELGRRAREAGFSVLCAFAHDAHYFVRLGFSIVPHVWFPEKITLDCIGCPKFRRCGQHAMALALTDGGILPTLRRWRAPFPSAHGATGDGRGLPAVRLRAIA
jgi:amino-acid N-acetyltransferase